VNHGRVAAVLFDVGGPIDTEVEHERLVDLYMRKALAAEGVHVTGDDFAASARWAVEAFAPHAYAAIMWRLCSADPALARRVEARFAASSAQRRARRGPLELRSGMAALFESLHERRLKLGLAANQPASVVAELDGFGIGHLFSHREVSGHHGYRKPDVRLFLRACEDLGVEPAATIMVGDRIDNDIVPARLLGMRTVLFRTGRHIEQQPRSADEVPDAEVRDAHELRTALEAMLSG
jgi:HAD superfamily hydrolase (TIGR01509 family)